MAIAPVGANTEPCPSWGFLVGAWKWAWGGYVGREVLGARVPHLT